MQTWKTIKRQVAFQHSKYLTVENHWVELPDGRVIEDWNWVISPDYVNIAALTESGMFLCFRQAKYGVEGISLAPPGGFLEPGEAPLAGAQRELLEETGFTATSWTPMGHYRVDASHGAGMANFFLAHGARQVASKHSDDLEEQQLILLSPAEVRCALQAGEFKALPWSAIMALALARL